jgi:hypothetical protein
VDGIGLQLELTEPNLPIQCQNSIVYGCTFIVDRGMLGRAVEYLIKLGPKLRCRDGASDANKNEDTPRPDDPASGGAILTVSVQVLSMG